MKVAVINETSAADKNADILSALKGRGLKIINVGMKEKGVRPELQYIHTGLMAAILLNLKRVNFVIGGCGTGQGFLLSAMQYPGVFCGHILTPLDGWLFVQINNGNCISLALNQCYGWAGDVNLRLIFDNMFNIIPGSGYPSKRKEPQTKSRKVLKEISKEVHISLAEIINKLSSEVIDPVIEYPGFIQLVDVENIEDLKLKNIFQDRLNRL